MTRDSSGPAAGRAKERLAGSTILLTGASGFLGKAVLATLLGRVDSFGQLIVLLRASDDVAAGRRLEEEVLAGEAFAALSGSSIREMFDRERLCAVAGDLAVDEIRVRSGWQKIDTVIHCAASVSFEEPLDSALALNALGPSRLLASLRDAGAHPHFVHVSTAYVADAQSPVRWPRTAHRIPEWRNSTHLAWRM